MLKRKELADVKVITIEATTYLGIVKVTEGAVSVEKAMKIAKDIDKSIMIDYILAENAGELSKPLEVIGAFTAAHISLSDDQAFEFETALRECERFAAKQAKAAQNAFVKKNI